MGDRYYWTLLSPRPCYSFQHYGVVDDDRGGHGVLAVVDLRVQMKEEGVVLAVRMNGAALAVCVWGAQVTTMTTLMKAAVGRHAASNDHRLPYSFFAYQTLFYPIH